MNRKLPAFATLAALHLDRKDLWVEITNKYDHVSETDFNIECSGCGFKSYGSYIANARQAAQDHANQCTGLGGTFA